MWAVTELYLVSPKQVAASAVGLARRALEEAIKYSMERKTMGKPIFQVLYHYMRNFCNLIGLEPWYFSLI